LATFIAGPGTGPHNAEPLREAESVFSDPRSRLLSKREIARFLGKSPNSVDRLRKKRVIPCLVVGGSIRFRLSDVERALARYQVKEVTL
jgi:predicted DNA-binding transcriptional regulator AlpA